MKAYIPLVALVIGILVGGFVSSQLLHIHGHDVGTHPIGTTVGDEIHVHADWKVVINGEVQDFTDAKYQSTGNVVKHHSLHLHDGGDEVIHRHANATFLEFFSSLGFALTDTCLTTDTGNTYCEDQNNVLAVYVNGEEVTDVTTYVFAEEDQILVYYGENNLSTIAQYQAEVTDEACLFSGTCPERGVATTSECGLTCEVYETNN